MAEHCNAPRRRFQEHLDAFRKDVEELCQSLFSKLQHEADGYAYELDQRSIALDLKAEDLVRRENACNDLEKKIRGPSKQRVEKRNVGVQTGQQSASFDARKLYGDLTAGDKTHHDVRLAFVEYFNKHRRSFSGVFLGGGRSSISHCNAPCYIFQVAYEQAQEYILRCFVAELMKLFGNKEVEDADILDDKKRALMLLLENIKTAPEFRDIVAFLSQSSQQQTDAGTLRLDGKKLEERASKLLRQELYQVFKGASLSDSNSKEVWENRRCSFGLLLHITQIKQTQPYEVLKQDILSRLKKHQSKFGALFAQVPTLIEESVKIVWDMVTLNPPAISSLPQDFNEDWHDKHATQWEDSTRKNALVYYNPVLFFGFNLDVAHRGEVGNVPPGSASKSHTTNPMVSGSASNVATFVKRVCTYCRKETKPENVMEIEGGASVCLPCYRQHVLPGLTHCRFCQHDIQSRGGGYLLEGNTSMICKRCHSERFLHCRKCKRHISDERLTVQAVGYIWHASCLKCCVCQKTITGKCFPHPQYPQEPVCYDCLC